MDNIEKLLKDRPIIVPRYLFNYYLRLGITAEELIVLIFIIDKGDSPSNLLANAIYMLGINHTDMHVTTTTAGIQVALLGTTDTITLSGGSNYLFRFDDHKYILENIDVVKIDSEGADWLILQQIDLKKYNPNFVMYECLHLNQADKEASINYCASNGYVVTGLDHDAHAQLCAEKI